MPVPDSLPETSRGHTVLRALMLVGWTLVFWGTLVAGAVAWRSVEIGPAAAVRLVLQGSGHEWGWVSLGCAALAIVVWTAVGALVVRRYRQGRRET